MTPQQLNPGKWLWTNPSANRYQQIHSIQINPRTHFDLVTPLLVATVTVDNDGLPTWFGDFAFPPETLYLTCEQPLP